MPITFLWPAMLGSLLLLAPLAALYVQTQRRRRSLAARYGGFGTPAPSAGTGWRRALPPLLFLLGLALLGLAMARPQATLALPRLESTLILAFDVSGSMAATDLEPTRMDAARLLAEEFVRQLPPTARVGVVAFSDGGLTVQSPTNDAQEVLGTIARLEPQRSTAIGEGLLAGLRTIIAEAGAGGPGAAEQQEPAAPLETPATIVLFSDGENNGQPDPAEVALAAAELGVRIYTVGVGTSEGATLELDGFSVHSRLDESALRQIAGISGGAYYSAQDATGMRAIYDAMAARMTVRQEPTEITALLAGASLLLLLVGGLCSLLWFNRLA